MLRKSSLHFGTLVAATLALQLSSPSLSAQRGDEPESVPEDKEVKKETSGEQAEEKPRSGWAAVPLVLYSPETDLGLGGFAVHFFRLGDAPAESRTSSVAVVMLYTTRQQFIGELIPEFYWDEENWHLWSKLDYRYFPNFFWGIGNDMPDSQEEAYNENGPRWQIWLRRTVYYSLYLEARVDAQYMKISSTQEGGLLDTGAVPGAEAGRTIGTGLTLGWDSRDHALSPHIGSFHEVSTMVWHRGMGSEYNFSRLIVNLRQFIPVTETHTLALQLYSEFLMGDVPFHKMAMIGGQRLLRGYYEGRYRDRDLVAVQAEYRLPIVWRINGVVFGGIGEVADRIADFDFSHPKWTLGGGLRLELDKDEKLSLRVDGGFGFNTYGFYLGLNEAF